MTDREHNTSATGGYLPLSDGTGDAATDDLLQRAIAGITGLPGERVRPRWQSEPPRGEEADIAWASFGVVRIAFLGCEARHVGRDGGRGHSELVSWEEMTVLAVFYGPEGLALARLSRDALHVEQNRAPLRAAGLQFIRAEDITSAPFVYNGHWRNRADLPLVFRRDTRRVVPVLNLRHRGAGSFLRTDTGLEARPDGREDP